MSFQFIEEWSQIWSRCNWYTFTPISMEFENDVHMGKAEAVVMFFGLGFRVAWCTNTDAEGRFIIKARMEELAKADSDLL